jgi:hypothetical protein
MLLSLIAGTSLFTIGRAEVDLKRCDGKTRKLFSCTEDDVEEYFYDGNGID